jgi:hypothetical protein
MNKPIKTKDMPNKDLWVISASNEEEAKAILKERIKNYYNLTEEEYIKHYES